MKNNEGSTVKDHQLGMVNDGCVVLSRTFLGLLFETLVYGTSSFQGRMCRCHMA